MFTFTSQVASLGLLSFNSFKQRFEITRSKTGEIISLNDFEKDSWPVGERLGENLQQVTRLIEVDKDVQLLNRVKILIQHHVASFQPLLDGGIVRMRYFDELHTTLLQIGDASDDILGQKCNVLYSSSSVEINELLNLRPSKANSWFIQWHLDGTVLGSNDHGIHG